MRYHPLRWIAVSFFVLSSTLNYLDRSLLSVLAPMIKSEFALNNQKIGWMFSAFSILYAVASLPSGWLLDRLGLTRGISIAAGFWSVACACTGAVSGAGSMALCRGALGAGEAASVPAFGKVNGEYLKPEERALGAALNGVGISLGSSAAALAIGLATVSGWRAPFVVSGMLGLVWIPLWWAVSRWIPSGAKQVSATRPDWSLLWDRPLLVVMLANLLWMSGFSLWSNWIPIYLMDVHHVGLQEVKSLVWIPPIVSNLGGFFGGWLSMRGVKRGVPLMVARRRAIWMSAVGCLSALALLSASTALLSTVYISISFFFILAGSVNFYALPIDLYGASRAGLAIAALTCAYGVLQAVISPVIGWMGDHHLYYEAVWFVAAAPLAASLLLLRLRV